MLREAPLSFKNQHYATEEIWYRLLSSSSLLLLLLLLLF